MLPEQNIVSHIELVYSLFTLTIIIIYAINSGITSGDLPGVYTDINPKYCNQVNMSATLLLHLHFGSGSYSSLSDHTSGSSPLISINSPYRILLASLISTRGGLPQCIHLHWVGCEGHPGYLKFPPMKCVERRHPWGPASCSCLLVLYAMV